MTSEGVDELVLRLVRARMLGYEISGSGWVMEGSLLSGCLSGCLGLSGLCVSQSLECGEALDEESMQVSLGIARHE